MDLGKLKVAMVQLATLFILLFIALGGYAAYSENRAEKHANRFCADHKIGEEVKGLLEKAIAAGADERRTKWRTVQNEDDSLAVIFTGATPISRHICSIRAVDGKIKEIEYAYLD